jgi:hypothetical protein
MCKLSQILFYFIKLHLQDVDVYITVLIECIVRDQIYAE